GHRKTSADDGDAIAQPLQHPNQRLGPFGEWELAGDLVEDLDVEPRQELHALAERLVVVHLASHGPLGDLGYFRNHTGVPRQLVDHLDTDQGGIHVHHHEALGATVKSFTLEANVERPSLSDLEERTLQNLGIAAYRQEAVKLHRGERVFRELEDLLDVGFLAR